MLKPNTRRLALPLSASCIRGSPTRAIGKTVDQDTSGAALGFTHADSENNAMINIDDEFSL